MQKLTRRFILLAALVANVASAKEANERIRVFAVDGRPLIGLQMLQEQQGLSVHIFKFNQAGTAYEINVKPADVIQGFSETTYLISTEFSLVIPSGTNLAAVPTLLRTPVMRPANVEQKPIQIEMEVGEATPADLNVLRDQPGFSSTPPVRYEALTQAGVTRVVIQTRKVGQNYEKEIFRILPNGNAQREAIETTIVGFSDTIFTLSSGGTLSVPTMPGTPATLTEDAHAQPNPERLQQRVEMAEVPLTDALAAKIHSAHRLNRCLSIFK